MTTAEAYAILGLDPNADTMAAVKAAWRAAAAKYHPDAPGGGDLQTFLRCGEAFQYLKKAAEDRTVTAVPYTDRIPEWMAQSAGRPATANTANSTSLREQKPAPRPTSPSPPAVGGQPSAVSITSVMSKAQNGGDVIGGVVGSVWLAVALWWTNRAEGFVAPRVPEWWRESIIHLGGGWLFVVAAIGVAAVIAGYMRGQRSASTLGVIAVAPVTICVTGPLALLMGVAATIYLAVSRGTT